MRHPPKAGESASDTEFMQFPDWVRIAWFCQCATMLLMFDIPGVPFAPSTILAAPCLIFAVTRMGGLRNLMLRRILLAILGCVWIAGLAADAISVVYLNFSFWIVNAYVAYKFLGTQHGRSLALAGWGVGLLLLMATRFLGFALIATNRNGHAYLAVVFMGPTYVFIRQRFSRRLSDIFLIVCLLHLSLLASRSGIVVGILTVGFLAFGFSAGVRGRLRAVLAVVLLFAMFALASPWLRQQSPMLAQRLDWVDRLQRYGFSEFYSGGGATVRLRHQLAKKAWQLFEREPVHGVGLMRFARPYRVHAQSYLNVIRLPRLQAHNSYLQWLSETGLLGAVPLAIFLGWLFLQVLRAPRVYRRNGHLAVAAGACMSLAVVIELLVIGNITGSGAWVAMVASGAFNRDPI